MAHRLSPAPRNSSAAPAIHVATGSPPLTNVNPSAGVIQWVSRAAPTPTAPGQQHNEQRQDDEQDQPTWHGKHIVDDVTPQPRHGLGVTPRSVRWQAQSNEMLSMTAW